MDPPARPVPPAADLPASSFDLRHLRYFIAVAEQLSFTRAARKLNVVQQTLSEGIAQLEGIIGLRLFERAGRPVALVALSERHPLAGRADVTFAEIAHEPWIEVTESDPVWCALLAGHRAAGRAAARGGHGGVPRGPA